MLTYKGSYQDLHMIPSKNATDLIRKYEGCVLESYEDSGGVWTIGWGTTGPGIQEGLRISQATADAMLIGHVREIGLSLTDLVANILNQNQFDACICLTYNIGMHAFRTSTLLKLLRTRDFPSASLEFPKWDKVDGRVLEGLSHRRLAELALFNTP